MATKPRALVIDGNPESLRMVGDILDSLDHDHDKVSDQAGARRLLKSGEYSYILLDPRIPVSPGRLCRIENGVNVLREIRARKTTKGLPVIVMSGEGNDGPDLATYVFKRGATDYVTKPLGLGELDRAIQEALGKTRAGTRFVARNGTAKRGSAVVARRRRKAPAPEPRKDPEPSRDRRTPRPFEKGEMVFTAERVDLEGVKICGGAGSGRIRKILDELRRRDARGHFVAYGGAALARKVGCDERGQNGVAEAVRDFRRYLTEVMRYEANLVVAPRDVIESGGRGYRLTDKIAVRDGDDPQSGPQDERVHGKDDPQNEPVHGGRDPQSERVHRGGDPKNEPVHDPVNDPLNERQEWVLGRLRAGSGVRVGEVVAEFKCSETTAKRDLVDMRRRGLAVFEGSPRTGAWRLKAAGSTPTPAQGAPRRGDTVPGASGTARGTAR